MKTNFIQLPEPSKNIPFGEQRKNALATWSDDHQKISAIEDDGRIVFFLDIEGRIVSWIPKEILASFPVDGI